MRPFLLGLAIAMGTSIIAPELATATTSTDYVFFHGIRENERAWNGATIKLLTAPYATSQQDAIYDWHEHISDGSAEVRSHLDPSRTLLTGVAYSQGALVSREYIRLYNNDPMAPHIGSLVTVAGVNAGVPIVNHLVEGGELLATRLGFLALLFLPPNPYNDFGWNRVDGTWALRCPPQSIYEASVAITVLGGIYVIATMVDGVESAPVRDDFKPTSSVVTKLNANGTCEANVSRGSISGNEAYPQLYRLGAPSLGWYDRSGSDRLVRAISVIEQRHFYAGLLAKLSGQPYLAAAHFLAAYSLHNAPKKWNHDIVGYPQNDGIVPLPNAQFPNVTTDELKVNIDGVNHTGIRKSSLSAGAFATLKPILDSQALDTQRPAPPTGLGGPTGCVGASTDLTWSRNCSAYSELDYSRDPTFPSGPGTTVLTNLTGELQHLDSLAPNSTYYWRMRSVNSVGAGDYSPTATFITRPLPSATNSWSWDKGIYLGQTGTQTLTVTPSDCPTTFSWVLTNGTSDNYSVDVGNRPWGSVTNHGVSNAITLDFAVTMTNTVGSTVQHVGFPLKTGSGLASGEPAALIAGEQPVEPHLDLVSRDGELQLSIGGGPFKDGSLAIFDVAGRRVHSWQNIATGFSDKFLRADGLREGLYMVRFEWAPLGDGGLHIVSRKVMIAR